METQNEELNGLPDAQEFIDNDLKVLEDISWRRAAYHVWHDAVKKGDPMHSQKWAGMFSARALHSIEKDSRRLKQLTWALTFLTLLLCTLTVILCWHELPNHF
jgi:hypothetical protein